MSLPELGTEYTRPNEPGNRKYLLVATHTTTTRQLDGVRGVVTTSFTSCFFRDQEFPLGGEIPVPSLDCDHEKREIYR